MLYDWYGTTINYNSSSVLNSNLLPRFTKVTNDIPSPIYNSPFTFGAVLPITPPISLNETNANKFYNFFQNSFHAYHRTIPKETILFDHRILSDTDIYSDTDRIPIESYGLYDFTKLSVLAFINTFTDTTLTTKLNIDIKDQIIIESQLYVGLIGWINLNDDLGQEFYRRGYVQEAYYKIIKPNNDTFLVHVIPSSDVARILTEI
jgi:hypothetical protein